MSRSSRLARAAHLTADIRLGAILALIGGGLAAWTLAPGTPPTAHKSGALDAKLSDRLAFVQADEEVPVRETRIYDTLAMFALPQADARTWSEGPVAASAPSETGIAPAPAAVRATPRMVAAEAQAPRRAPDLPPARPTFRNAAAAPAALATAALAFDEREPAREPVQIMGWDLPGTELLPTRRDAARTANAIGGKAVALGSGTAKVVTDTATAMGDGVSLLGGAIADTIGLR